MVLPLAVPATAVSAELLDQRGQALPVPVAGRTESGETGDLAVAELSLAPLAARECAVRIVIEIGGTRHERVVAFRVTT